MADNTTLDSGSGGDTIRTEDRTTYKTPVSLIDVGGVAAEALIGDAGNYMPVAGAAAENAAAAGNPVLIAGRYDATPRTLGDGDAGGIALDADGAVHISDGGNTITVDGTVTANLSATDNAVLDAIAASVAGTLTVGLPTGAATEATLTTIAGYLDTEISAIVTAVQLLDNIVSGSEAQVDVVTSALPTGAATAANQSTGNAALAAIQTAVELIDNAISGTEMQVDIVTGAVSITGDLPDTTTGDLAAINSSLTTIAGAVAGTEVQVDIVSGSITLGAGTANIGDVDIDSLPNGLLDSFGHMVTGAIKNQVDVQFYRDTPANLTTVTTAGTGTATATGGMATFASGASAGGRAEGVSLTSTVYTAGAEMYVLFTAGFTGTGSSDTYQRIGLYDANDGFFIGDEGGTFGITVRKGAADTQTAKASFSEDDLTGGGSSLFTRAGSPEAIDLTKLNVWRIRFGWVGSAPIKFDVLSPDGNWVTFHQILQPNLAALPSIENADLPVTCDVDNNSVAVALSIITNCWCAGTTQSQSTLDATVTDSTLAELGRSVIVGKNSSGTYSNVALDDQNSLLVNPEVGIVLDDMDATTGWAALDTDTTNIATTGKHVIGTAAVKFDKANTAANSTLAGIEKTITAVDLGDVSSHDTLQVPVYLSTIADVSYVWVRIGTDSSNYNEWRVNDTELTAASWQALSLQVGSASYAGTTGNGWDPSAITYIAVGVAFDAETDTLTDITFDDITYHTNVHTTTSITAEVSSSVSSPNVKINGYGGATDTNTGNASNNTLRTVLATDQPSVSVRHDTAVISNAGTDLTPKYAVINATVNGDNTIVSAVVGKKIRVLAFAMVADAAVGAAFEDGAGGSELMGQMAFAANGGISAPFCPVGWFETTANTLLNLETDAAANVRGMLVYVEV